MKTVKKSNTLTFLAERLDIGTTTVSYKQAAQLNLNPDYNVKLKCKIRSIYTVSRVCTKISFSSGYFAVPEEIGKTE